MGKQPYIPLYIGDWEQDTNCLSIEAEGAWLKIVFKCWKNKGIFMTNIDSVCNLWRVDKQKAASILLELKNNNVGVIERREDGGILFTSPRIVRDFKEKAEKAAFGRKGGEKTQAKIKNSLSKSKAGALADSEYEYDTESESESERKIGGKGERTADLPEYELWTQAIKDNSDHTWEPMYMNSGLKLQTGRYLGLIEDHLQLLARYPKMRPPNQQAFRHSLLKHIKENRDKQVQNGTATNKNQQHVRSLVEDYAQRYGSDAPKG